MLKLTDSYILNYTTNTAKVPSHQFPPSTLFVPESATRPADNPFVKTKHKKQNTKHKTTKNKTQNTNTDATHRADRACAGLTHCTVCCECMSAHDNNLQASSTNLNGPCDATSETVHEQPQNRELPQRAERSCSLPWLVRGWVVACLLSTRSHFASSSSTAGCQSSCPQTSGAGARCHPSSVLP
jgi:hypothetical protein